MKFKDRLTALQAKYKCEHVAKLGEPCDQNGGGWWTCMCAVAADKQETQEHRLSVSNGERDSDKS